MTAERIAATLTIDQAVHALWDVLVIGAGPSGSVAAREAARQGVRTLLVDRCTFPRPKVCGCCLNGAALGVLNQIGLGDLPLQQKARPLTEFRLASQGNSVSVPLSAGVSLSRERLDMELVRAAIDAGSDFIDGTEAVVGESTDASLDVGLRKANTRGRVAARVVVVSGGLGCHAFAKRNDDDRQVSSGSRIGAGCQLHDPSNEFASGTIYMTCHRHGYVGLVRLEDGRLDIAAALVGNAVKQYGGMGAIAAVILESSGMKVPGGMAHATWCGTPKLTQSRRRVFGDRFFVVGDAAGYVEPFTGEGIAWALATGSAVIPFAVASLERGTQQTGPAWARRRHELLKRRVLRCRVLSRLLRYPWLVAASVGILSRAPGLASPIIKSLNANF